MYDRTILETIDYHRTMLADEARLLAKNGKIIPHSVELVVVPVEVPDAFELLDSWAKQHYTQDLSPVGVVVANNLLWDNLSPISFLSQPATVIQADLATITGSDIVGEGHFVAGRDGRW